MKNKKNQHVEINRHSLWDGDQLEKYWAATERSAREKAARKDGEHTAEDLDRVWNGLDEEEKQFIEFLLLSGKRTSVAFYEEDLFTRLVSKGLLQIPPGVGTLFMQQLRTTYSVPLAVWKCLQQRHRRFFPLKGKKKGRRLDELTKLFDSRIEAVFENTSLESDVR